MYQWAATMTQSGANFPFALPLKADRLPAGFQISLLKRSKSGGFASAGDIVATVEEIAGVGEVFMVRFFEGPVAMEGRRASPCAPLRAQLVGGKWGIIAVSEALDILDIIAKKIQIPEYKTTIEIPIIGGINVDVSGVNITNLQVPRELAKVAIESGYYHLKAANLTAQITFNWAWSKGPLSGSGYGELSLEGGSLDEIFLVPCGMKLLVLQDLHDWAMAASAAGGLVWLWSSCGGLGLPFDAVFTYAVYTLNYVIVKGYGEVALGPKPSESLHTSTLDNAEIGGDGSMFSTYLHEAIPNCILWGLHQSGGLHTSVQDGNIPQLRLITDLFGGLIPELPKHYPKKGMLMEIVMTEAPQVQFRTSSNGSVILSARYDTNVSVLDAAGDGATLLVAQLTANVSIAADFGWAQTVIHGTAVSYAVLWEMYPVNVKGWNMIIDWVVKQAGPKQSLGQLWDTYVKTPATPFVALDNVTTAATDHCTGSPY
eukprot:gene4734-4984_t